MSKKLVAISGEALCATVLVPLTQVGNWQLSMTEPPSLDCGSYEVVLFERGADWKVFTAWLGRWASHLPSSSRGFNSEEIGDFVSLACDVWHHWSNSAGGVSYKLQMMRRARGTK